jgi:phage terminase large subunit
MWAITTALKKITDLPKRIKIVFGATYSGKTYDIMVIAIDDCLRQADKDRKHVATVVAETIPAVKSGALRFFKEIMQDMNIWNDANWNGTDRVYKFSNKVTISFTAYDTIGKAKQAGKRDWLFINEANHGKQEIYQELISRTDGDVYVDYNPDESFWVDKELALHPEACNLKLTYKDNEATPESKLIEFEYKRELAKSSKYWDNWCRVYLDGEYGTLEGVVFPDIEIVDVVPDPLTCQYHGLDFGWNDETAIVSRYKYKDGYLLHQRYYKGNTLTARLAEVLRTLEPKNIIADREAKQTIMDLKMTHGINKIQAYTTAGKDGKQSSIDKMKSSKIYVTATSLELIEDFRGYRLLDGEYVGRHHGIDAARYTFMAGATAGAKGFGNF